MMDPYLHGSLRMCGPGTAVIALSTGSIFLGSYHDFHLTLRRAPVHLSLSASDLLVHTLHTRCVGCLVAVQGSDLEDESGRSKPKKATIPPLKQLAAKC